MADKSSNTKERLKAITESIETGIRDIFQSEKYFEYLRTMSRFHKYSVNNTILIHLQKPDASLVAGFRKWQKDFNRNVKKGEHGITIIAPTPFKKKIEEEKLDPDTKLPMLDADGKVIMEEKVIQIPFYKPVKVFDVSQTVGDPLPQLVSNLSGDVKQFEIFLEALRRSSPVPISIEPIKGSMDGFFSPEKQSITLREGMSQVQTICAAIHEIAHSILHNDKQDQEIAAESGEPIKPKDRNTQEVEAESIAYSVCAYYGIDTGENSLGYILSWSKNQELPELRASLETINKTASSLITSIDRHFDAICKERGIDRNAEKEITPEEDTPERFAADYCAFFDRAEQEGMINRPTSMDTRDLQPGVALLISNGSFESLRSSLIEAISGGYDLKTVDSLMNRLDSFQKQWEASIEYRTQDYELSSGEHDRCCVCEYEKKDDGLSNRGIVFVGSEARCQELTQKLNDHSISVEKVKAMDREEPPAQETSTLESSDTPPVETGEDLSLRIGNEREQQAPPPEPSETVVLPDPAISIESMNAYGYVSDDMLPLTKERAKEIFEHGGTVFMLYEGTSEGMVFEPEDIDMHSGIFGITREDWTSVQDEIPPPKEPEKPLAPEIKLPDSAEVEARFRESAGDRFIIYQLKNDESTYGIAFENFTRMKEHGKPILYANYDAIYTGDLPKQGDTNAKLEELYEQFNIRHPADFTGHSMSISDIVAIRQAGEVSCYYVDNIGFQLLTDFLPAENYLKAAEMAMEDDYNMIDGIINNGPKQPTVAELEGQARSGQPISLLDLADATRREKAEKKKPASKNKKPPQKAKKPSVLAKLRHYQNMDRKEAPARENKERGL